MVCFGTRSLTYTLRYPSTLIPGSLIRRYKRFLADVELASGEIVTAHSTNTGSMKGCSDPGSAVFLSPADNPKRKLKYTWEMVKVGKGWVGINTQIPNRVVATACEKKLIPEFAGYDHHRREVKYGKNSRIDLLLEGDDLPPCYVEIKNVTLKEGKAALFPDAVTARGKKHLDELADMAALGHRAVIFFFVGRVDCDEFRPADTIDPLYGETLRAVLTKGVEALAYRARFDRQGIRLEQRLPVIV